MTKELEQLRLRRSLTESFLQGGQDQAGKLAGERDEARAAAVDMARQMIGEGSSLDEILIRYSYGWLEAALWAGEEGGR